MRPLPPLNALRAFEAAARLGSYSRAAEELGVTHGAISRHIQSLQAFLGAELFRPAGRNRVPTERAAAYLAEVSAALDRLAGATERMREPSAARMLRINTLATFSMRWLIPRLSSFQIAHPRVEVRLITSMEPVERLSGDFDVVIRRNPMHRPGYTSRRFLVERNLPVAAPALLARYPLRTPRASQIPPNGQRFENYFFTLEAAARGLGFAVGALPLIADDLASGRLVTPLAGPISVSEGYHVLYPANRRRGSVMEFVDWLVAQGASADTEPLSGTAA